MSEERKAVAGRVLPAPSSASSLSDLCCLFLIADLVFEAAPCGGGGGGGSVALPVLQLVVVVRKGRNEARM